jgi:hypothetical protein
MRRQTKATFLSILFPTLVVLSASAQTREQLPGASAKRRLVVSLQDRKLALLEGGQVKKVYLVAVGKQSTPSPTGTFMIVSRVSNPTYSHRGKVIGPGAGNPVGTRWMGLSVNGYGIHGTNAPKSIGKTVSHGCIRMKKQDVEELFDEVRAGDEVKIVSAPDPETAAFFGGSPPSDAQTTSEETAPVTAEKTPAATTSASAIVPSGQ